MSITFPGAVEWLQRARVEYVLLLPTERINALQPGGELATLRDAHLPRSRYGRGAAAVVRGGRLARRHLRDRAPHRVRQGRLAVRGTAVSHVDAGGPRVGDDKIDLLSASFVVAAAALIIAWQPRRGSPCWARDRARPRNQLTTAYAIPVLLGLAVATLPRRRLAECAAAAIGAFAIVGAYGYVLNVIETGRPLGDPSATEPYRPDEITWAGTESTVARIGFRFFDLSGLHTKAVVANSIESAGRSAFDTLRIEPNPPETQRRAAVRLCRRPVVQRGHPVLRPARCAAGAPAPARFHSRDDRAPGAVGTAPRWPSRCR